MSSAKFVLLQKLRSERDILFSEFGPSTGVTKSMKVQKWNEIANLARNLGILSASKPWQYLRNVIWPNWRKRAVARQQAGAQLSELDEMVMEIMAKPEEPFNGVDSEPSVTQMHIDSFLNDSTHDTVYITPADRKRKRYNFATADTESNNKKLRTNLQIECLQIKAYKMRLEALEIEMRLGLPRSSITKDLPQQGDSPNLDLYKTER